MPLADLDGDIEFSASIGGGGGGGVEDFVHMSQLTGNPLLRVQIHHGLDLSDSEK